MKGGMYYVHPSSVHYLTRSIVRIIRALFYLCKLESAHIFTLILLTDHIIIFVHGHKITTLTLYMDNISFLTQLFINWPCCNGIRKKRDRVDRFLLHVPSLSALKRIRIRIKMFVLYVLLHQYIFWRCLSSLNFCYKKLYYTHQ